MTMYIRKLLRTTLAAAVLLLSATSLFAAGRSEQTAQRSITLYSGRGESLVAPLIEQFEAASGILVNVRYGGTAELAVLLQEEGDRSPADLYWGQDAGALGAVASAGLLQALPDELFALLPPLYQSERGEWIATSGRARVLAYAPDLVEGFTFPDSIFDLVDRQYRGRVGWAPTNGSFQSFVTAMRVRYGDGRTQEWVEGMIANDAQIYRNNTAIVEALGAGEIAMGITNNYYLLRFLADDPSFPVRQRFFADGDIGNLVNVASIGILRTAEKRDGAVEFIRFLLDTAAQEYFTEMVYEYPVIDSVVPAGVLESFDRVIEVAPEIDLDDLEDLEGTLNLLRRAGAL